MKLNTLLCSAMAYSIMAGAAWAEYPEKPITFVIPYGAGGTTDIGARTWGPFLETCLGQPIVYLNLPGAGGQLGFAELAKAAPDGYTLGALPVPTFPTAVITQADVTFALDSFVLLGNLYGSFVTINTNEQSGFENLGDLVDAAKSGTTINLGITNFGSDDHLTMLKVAKAADIAITFVPLADSASTRNAVAGGHINAAGLSLTDVTPYQEQLKTLAIAAPERRPELPDVPTFRELGYDVVGGTTNIIGAPAGVPDEIVAKLAACFEQTGTNPDFLKAAAERNLILNPMTLEQTRAFFATEVGNLEALWDSDPWVK